MKRLLSILIGLSVVLHAYTYHRELLQVYGKIAPRMMLLVGEQEAKNKTDYLLCILYEPGDENHAQTLREMMVAAYPDGFKGRKFRIETVTFGHCDNCRDADLLMLFDTQPQTIRRTVEKAKARGIATMAYSSRFLQEGVLLSLDLGATVRPYINLQAAKDGKIPVNDVLLRISKIYQKDGGE